jgi:enoyl-CoA hydratase/carnithine racemase
MADIRLDLAGRAATLLIDRPEKRNAFTMEMWAAIPPLLASIAEDASIGLLIVRGAGGSFSAGADVGEFAETFATPERAAQTQRTIEAAIAAVAAFPTPTAALIRGACVGGGCGLALACDLRVATSDARFGVTPGRLGLIYGIADTRRLVRAIGVSRAKDLLFTGRLVDAAEAAAFGLVDRVTEHADAELEALQTAICASSGEAARMQKTIFRRLLVGAGDDDAEAAELFLRAAGGPDFAEGRAAFLEKRRPDFADPKFNG